jgi:hypothetical protein
MYSRSFHWYVACLIVSLKKKSNRKIIMRNFSIPTGLALALVSVACAGSLNAQVSAVIGGNAQSGETYVNFDSLLSGQSSSYATGALTVSFTGNASTVAGNGPFGATDPYLSGNNNEFFEASTPAGYDATTYLQAGDNRIGANGAPDNGSIIFSFSVPQTYLGLLLGSIDANNTLTFYAGQNGTGGVVDIAGQSSITGSYLNSLNSSINIGDYTDSNGTAYVNIDSSAPFESVVATTGTTTFEIDNVSYNNNGVPDGGMTIALLGGTLAGLQALRRKLVR